MKLKALDHMVITTKDFDACVHFYVDLLGMRLVQKEGRYALHFGRHKFNIHRRPAEYLPAAERPVPGALDFCLEVEDPLEDVLAEMRAKQAPVISEIVPKNGANGKMRSFYLRDPDGNLVELSEYD